MEAFRRGDLVFDVLDTGPRDGEPVALLHGFPQGKHAWDGVADLLNRRGLRTLAPDQRGYSPGARPARRRDYRLDLLVDDVLAMLGEAGVAAAHLVGHDLGALVGWRMAARNPERVASLTALSVPHPAAYLRALVSSRQLLHSWYAAAFQLPWLPELAVRGGPGARARVRWALARTGLPAPLGERYLDQLTDRAALTAMLNWYRAIPLTRPAGAADPVDVPTTFVWSTRDGFLDRYGAESTARYCRGDYRFEVVDGASHWLPEQHPQRVAELIFERVAAVSAEPLSRSG